MAKAILKKKEEESSISVNNCSIVLLTDIKHILYFVLEALNKKVVDLWSIAANSVFLLKG